MRLIGGPIVHRINHITPINRVIWWARELWRPGVPCDARDSRPAVGVRFYGEDSGYRVD